jgi:hypothetical protein
VAVNTLELDECRFRHGKEEMFEEDEPEDTRNPNPRVVISKKSSLKQARKAKSIAKPAKPFLTKLS